MSEILYITYDKYKKEKIGIGFCFIYCDKLFWDMAPCRLTAPWRWRQYVPPKR